MPDRPVIIAVASYSNKASAEGDYDAIRGIGRHHQPAQIAIAFVGRSSDGTLVVERHDSTARHLAWGDGLIGAALVVVSPPLGIGFLGPLAETGEVWSGVVGFVGHFHCNVSKDDVGRMSGLLDACQFGLVVVVVNPRGADVVSLLANAVDTVAAVNVPDPDGAVARAFDEAAI